MDPPTVLDGEILQARDYQLEMLKLSLEKNIIVAMDTGSGKTQIAILRIAAELERSPPEKLVWFLVPAKALAQQQHDAIASQLPSVQCRLLTGDDGVDRWSDQWIWNQVLKDVKVVISTHQVLLDALTHGFVRMGRISLLIFDEAHWAMRDHPANRILHDFYHPLFSRNQKSAPHILGLTASPEVSSRNDGMEQVERNLNALCKTPILHRDQLLKHVHRPEMEARIFQSSINGCVPSIFLARLTHLYKNLDIEMDPFVLRHKSLGRTVNFEPLAKALDKKSTFCQKQMKMLTNTAKTISDELGSWAADYYISSCVNKIKMSKVINFDFEGLEYNEKEYLRNLFANSEWPSPATKFSAKDSNLSSKAQCLLDILSMEASSNQAFVGLVFTQTRASVGVIAHLLSSHHQTKDLLKVGTFVGSSDHPLRKNLSEINDVEGQTRTLNDLRVGKKNLIVATSVLEEGIDITACNVVVCFEKPQNLKSFIQRRGRARQSKSKYIIMFSSNLSGGVSAHQWRTLEEGMKRKYMDQMRELEHVKALEDSETGNREYIIEKTGAKITLHSAKTHLYQFCALLPSTQYIRSEPQFTFGPHPSGKEAVLATVVLPSAVDPLVRSFSSASPWMSQKMASRDAAFVACVGLYQAGLLNDNWLPLLGEEEEGVRKDIEKRERLLECSPPHDAWPNVAQAWNNLNDLRVYSVKLESQQANAQPFMMRMISPAVLPALDAIHLHWDEALSFSITMDAVSGGPVSFNTVETCAEITKLLFRSNFESRMLPDQKDFPLLFLPSDDTAALSAWHAQMAGFQIINEEPSDSSGFEQRVGIIRAPYTYGMIRYIYHGFEFRCPRFVAEGDEMDVEKLCFKLSRFPKRADFLHKIPKNNMLSPTKGDGITYLPVTECQVDNLPFAYSQFAAFIPSLMHHIQISLVVQDICLGLLAPIGFQDRSLVKTAISASSARESTNYQRLEFLGDSVLKCFTALNLTASYLTWHEGYLSRKKDHTVSNGRLSRAAIEKGLDKYILTKAFTGQKWRPYYNHSILEAAAKETDPRQLSTKVLADVVEAIIGAAILDGGESKAVTALSVFLPEVKWRAPLQCVRSITSSLPARGKELSQLPLTFEHVEPLIGRSFEHKILLLEALTYASYEGAIPTPSYQRLEFLGDSVLDYIITRKVFGAKTEISTPRMHLIRTALANANFLAYLCLNLEIMVPKSDVIEDRSSHHFVATERLIPKSIWHYMRHTIAEVVLAQRATVSRFQEQRARVKSALETGSRYPWLPLTLLAADKFFSDLIESLLGAIYVDAAGDLQACEAFLARIGLLPCLERIVAEPGIQVMHPKEWLGVLAGQEQVRYHVLSAEEEQEAGFEEGGVTCRITVGARALGVVRGRSKVEAEVAVAEAAVEVLRGEGREDGVVGLEREDEPLSREEPLHEEL